MKDLKDAASNTKLLAGIIALTAVVVGSLVFVLVSSGAAGGVSDAVLDARIDAGIQRYVTKKTAEAQQGQEAAQAQEAARGEAMAANLPLVDAENEHVYGNKDAEISLVEYSDFLCPYCQKFHSTAKQVVDKYAGKVNWVYRHWPLPSHDPGATARALASECVAELGGNGAFWEYGDVLFSTAASERQDLIDMASRVGVNASAMGSCLDSQKYLAKVQQQIEEGTNAGVNGTPGNFLIVNATGKVVPVPGGAQELDYVSGKIDPLL